MQILNISICVLHVEQLGNLNKIKNNFDLKLFFYCILIIIVIWIKLVQRL